MITVDQQNLVFTLHTRRTTYQMKAGRHGVLLHTYYGPRIRGGDLSPLIQLADRASTPWRACPPFSPGRTRRIR